MLSQIHQVPLERITTVKIKINGICIRNCVFCTFNNDTSRLDVKNIDFFLDLLNEWDFKRIIINGGEPSLHPNYCEITDFLRAHYKGRKRLELGTNLVTFGDGKARWRQLWQDTLETYDRIQVGCDDEHDNIEYLEQLTPEILNAGIRLAINVIDPYCGVSTRNRILSIAELTGVSVEFSRLMHDYQELPRIRESTEPCSHRVRDLLLNCNGDVFFCYQQEHEHPLFNLYTTSPEEAKLLLFEHDPKHYIFCDFCERHSADSEV